MKAIMFLVVVLGALSAAGKLFHTKLGQSVILECGVTDFNSRISWLCGNDVIFSILKTGFTRKGQALIQQRSKISHETNLKISGVKKEDAGEFTCQTDQNSQKHTLLVISVSVNPPGVLNTGSKAEFQCEVHGLKPDSTVQWKKPNGQKYPESKVNLNSVELSDAGAWACIFSYDDVELNETLNINVKEPTAETTSPPQTSKVNQKYNSGTGNKSFANGLFSWWMWIVVGICSLVVIVLVVIVICLCKRIRRKRKKLQMMNARQLRRPNQSCQCNRPTAAGKPQPGRQRGRPSALPLQPLLKE